MIFCDVPDVVCRARFFVFWCTEAGAYSAHFFFFLSPKLPYVRFVLARDHLGKLEIEK